MTITKIRFQELRERSGLAWRILRGRDGNLVHHAHRETAYMRKGADGPDRWMADGLVDLARVLSTHGHSGFSARIAASALGPLLRFEPLGPLTGEEAEWTALDYGPDMQAQNNRCGHIFRRADGTAYDGEAVIFREPNGCCFTSFYSRADITFPYEPKRAYADVPEDATEEQKQVAAAAALAASRGAAA